ncbi:MAG: hypothetical protein MAG458_01739 [Nitrosopumilus sp.]|nr:hypothetical protein [Nitrosopumilus sp.]
MEYFNSIDGIKIPLRCSKCGGRMIATKYDPTIKILTERSWQLCIDCGFQRSAEQFKLQLLTV